MRALRAKWVAGLLASVLVAGSVPAFASPARSSSSSISRAAGSFKARAGLLGHQLAVANRRVATVRELANYERMLRIGIRPPTDGEIAQAAARTAAAEKKLEGSLRRLGRAVAATSRSRHETALSLRLREQHKAAHAGQGPGTQSTSLGPNALAAGKQRDIQTSEWALGMEALRWLPRAVAEVAAKAP